ncbi:MAG: ATP-binding cassette domain-containing protein [Bdellovibrionales bacterium]|nr:ATP-binding cassette domain-containing protein [Bdellovibrionales bacterium]
MSLLRRVINVIADRVFFAWLTPLLKTGSQRSLEVGDLPPLPSDLDPEALVLDESRISWVSGVALLKSLLRVSTKIWVPALGFFLLFAAMNLLGPVLVNNFVKAIQKGFSTPDEMKTAMILAALVGTTGIIGGVAIQHYFLWYLKWNQTVTNVVNKKIFFHALRLRKDAREAAPVGDLVNHLSSDTEAVADFGGGMADLIYSVVMIIGAVGLLFYYLGSTAWVAVVLLGVLAPMTKKVSRDFTSFDEDLMKWRDRRVTLMSQILTAIRLVKHFSWEKSVSEEVGKVREAELHSRERLARAELLVTLIYVAVGTFVLFAVLAVHSLRGASFDAALIFTCVSLFGLLEDPFAQISRVISTMITAKVGGERIAGFLRLPVVDEASLRVEAAIGGEHQLADQVAVHYRNLHVPPGTSLAVVGGVGSGKSTFLHVLMGEMSGFYQGLEIRGVPRNRLRIGFVSQEAFILNGTLLENLTFGRQDVSDFELSEALRASCLDEDLRLMPGGLQTEIGEKGINLSGGQRQRVSLARTILHRPNLVVLDDPLSAVDSATEKALVENLLDRETGLWKSVTRIMITHRLSHLNVFDQIGFLANGEFKATGKFEHLELISPEFRSYLEEYAFSQSHTAPEGKVETSTVVAAQAIGDERVTEDEDRGYGAVASGMYRHYLEALGGENLRLRPWVLLALAIAAMSLTGLPLLQKAWLAYVSDALSSGSVAADETGISYIRTLASQPMPAIYMYGAMGLFVMAGTLLADLFWLKRGLAAGRLIHDKMLKSVLGAKIRFFDSTPVGRTLQRFSRDLESVDIHLRWSFEHSIKCFAQVLLTLLLIVSVLPFVVIVMVPVFWVYYHMQKTYRASSREAKRLDSISRSPRYAHFKETLQGLVVIRAFDKKDWFTDEFFKRLRHNQRMFYGNYMINRWFSSRIPVVGGLISIATAVSIVLAVKYGSLSPGVAGLVTVYSLSFWGVLNWGIRIWAEVESRMTSLERVRHFANLPQEASVIGRSVVDAIPANWPTKGEIKFVGVKARYAENRPMILKGLDFVLPAGAKVGIVGRTGSGKSTVFQTLYRFIELEEGKILIDDVDISAVPLERLRRALAIIPQDPTLFIGTIRSNLDRYTEHTDAKIWSVLEKASLAEFVRLLPKGLDTELVENGVNLSQGQRQLLCLARALLLNAKIILLDEATASVDVKTDATVQRVLKEAGHGVTMLMIAHRLGTTRDCDLVLEIKDGHLGRVLKGPFGSKTALVPAPQV